MGFATNLPAGGPEIALMVREFTTAMGQSPDAAMQIKLISEESREFMNACVNIEAERSIESAENLLKEAADLHYVSVGLMNVIDDNGTEELAKALTTEEGMESMFNLQLAEEGMSILFDVEVLDGVMLLEAVKRVHASNMSKLGDDGLPIRREDGKILKGPNYTEPDLNDLATTVLERFFEFRS